MARSRFFTTEQLGPKQTLTPEKFLVIEDVPIARIGTQEYHTSEVNLPGDSNGIVRVRRDEKEVFSEKHILSYNGKAIVNDHPEGEDVTPQNYKTLTVGTVMNTRRGTGSESDLLIADFMICDEAAIAEVRAGKREVSCGYEADYNEIAPGEGEQVNLLGNHVALVEAGRCGARCSIQDRHPINSTGDRDMRVRTHDKKPGWADKFARALDRYVTAVKAKDEATEELAKKDMDDAMAEAGNPDLAGEEHTHVHVHSDGASPNGGTGTGVNGGGPTTMTDEEIRGGFGSIQDSLERMSATMDAIAQHVGFKGNDAEATEEIEGALEEEAPMGTGDKARKARDSVFLSDSFQQTVAVAEILLPGVRVPQFTRDAAPAKTLDAIQKLRAEALELLNNTPEGRGMIETVLGKPLTLDAMKPAAIKTLFNAVGAMRKQHNRDGHQGREQIATAARATAGSRYATMDMADQVAAYWKEKKAGQPAQQIQ